MAMTRTQTMVQLNRELLRDLDEEATSRGISRSALIREVLESHLAAQRADVVGERIVDGYRRIPPATPDEWGSLNESADGAALELMQRLAAEEREAGLEPW